MKIALGYLTMAAGTAGMWYAAFMLLPLPWFILVAAFTVYAIGYNLREGALKRERKQVDQALGRKPSDYLN